MIDEALDTVAAETTRTRRRAAARSSRLAAEPKVKVGLCLSAESAKRLHLHAVLAGVDRSDLVEQLVREHLRRFVIQDRGSRPTLPVSEDRQVEAAA